MIKRADIFGTSFSMTNLEETTGFIKNFRFKKKGYVCFPDMSVVSTASKDNFLKKILNSSTLTLPDGKPTEIVARLKGYSKTKTVSGYWLLNNLLNTQLNHFFYGGSEELLTKLKSAIDDKYPGANISGYLSPPMVELSDIQNNRKVEEHLSEINNKKPDVVWIGISSPKQDYLMHFYHKSLNQGLMIGVGGVFDYIAGTHKKSPEWMKKLGLRWLYRLLQDPARFWRRYLNVIIFIVLYPLRKKTINKS